MNRIAPEHSRKSLRDPNLDLIRAGAILLVLMYHVLTMWPCESHLIRKIASLGKHGVDLFFVLSGFLVGGLYFRELKSQNKVNGIHFWLRRAVRTMPPYFVALFFVYTSAKIIRGDSFDYSYLWFGQNYKIEMPYFWASWSLCVEEHAYVALVLFLGLAVSNKANIGLFLAMIVLSSAFTPFLDQQIRTFYGLKVCRNSSHLWYAGISFGVMASWIQVYQKNLWHYLQTKCRFIWPLLLSLACFVSYAGEFWRPYLAFLMAITCISILISFAGKPLLPLANSKIVRGIALISYSLYLTHGVVIHIGRYIKQKNLFLPEVVIFGIWWALIFVAGSLFYWAIEKKAINMRDRIVPKRC